MKMKTGQFPGARVSAKLGGGKGPLPRPFLGGTGVFFLQARRHMSLSLSRREIMAVAVSHPRKMLAQTIFERIRQRNDTVLASFCVMDLNGALSEINIFNPKFQGLALAESAAVHQFTEQFPRILQVGKDTTNFFASKNGRRAAPAAAGVGKLE